MQNDLISVIVPVYNVEGYLKECVDSVLAQTYSPIEIILVDDGSTDRSGAICDDYDKKNPNITVYHKLNGGLSSARNYGIKQAHGDLLAFVDSDDYLDPEMLSVLANNMQQDDADLCVCNTVKVYENGNCEACIPKYPEKTILRGNNVLFGTYDNFSAVNKLYRKNLFDNILFPEGKLYEDARTTYRIAAVCKTVSFDPKPLYFYRQRNSSIMGTFSAKNYLDRVNVWNEIIDFVKERFTDEQMQTVYVRKNKLAIELIASILAKHHGISEKSTLKNLTKEINYKAINKTDFSAKERLIAGLGRIII